MIGNIIGYSFLIFFGLILWFMLAYLIIENSKIKSNFYKWLIYIFCPLVVAGFCIALLYIIVVEGLQMVWEQLTSDK